MNPTDDPTLYNDWRARYPSMTFEDHVAFYTALEKDIGRMCGFDSKNISPRSIPIWIQKMKTPRMDVLELGGYNGGLAEIILPRCMNIDRWNNKEIIDCQQLCKDDAYSFEILPDFIWNCGGRFDWHNTFVASHVIEHFNHEHCLLFLDWLEEAEFDYLWIEAPLPIVKRTDWHNILTYHINPLNWTVINTLIRNMGYHNNYNCQWGYGYIRKNLK